MIDNVAGVTSVTLDKWWLKMTQQANDGPDNNICLANANVLQSP